VKFRKHRGKGDEARRAVEAAMAATAAGDIARASKAVRIIAQGGPDRITEAVSAWYTPVVNAMRVPGGVFALHGYDVGGAETAVDDISMAPGRRDALRLLTCRGNQDHETMHAIVLATWNTGLFAVAELMVASLQLAAALSRDADQRGQD
jgi:hypothetical protein